jgi:hypothetical protein
MPTPSRPEPPAPKEFLTSPVVLKELLTALQRLQRTRSGGDGSGVHGTAQGESVVIAVAGAAASWR